MPDLRAFDDLDEFGAECTSTLEELEQDVIHRLVERYGSNPDAPDRGLGVEEWLSSTITVAEAKARIENEIRRDERVLDVVAKVVPEGSDRWVITLEITTNEEELSRFDLELDADGLRRIG